MAPNHSAHIAEEDNEPGSRRRKAARYALPVAVAGVTAATIGLVPALASSGGPGLLKVSARQLIEKIAASDTQQLSGAVKITTDLGLPLDSLGGLSGASALLGKGSGGSSSADPGDKLMELSSGTHTLRIAVDGPDKQRVSIREDAAEYSLIRNGDEVWAYNSGSRQAYHAASPKGTDRKGTDRKGTDHKADHKGADQKGDGAQGRERLPATPQEFAEQALKAAGDTTSVSVGGTTRVAGRDAYQLVIKPKQAAGSTIGSITVAVDAKTGTPLKFTLAPSSGGKAVVDIGFTKVDFGKPAASTFDFKPPKDAEVTDADDVGAERNPLKESLTSPLEGLTGASGLSGGEGGAKVIGTGWNAVYQLTSPAGASLPTAPEPGEGPPAAAEKFMDSLGDKVSGKFGSGTVFTTRIVNALMTRDGKVYVGAVTKDALVKAANQAK
ncbi:outer membrane lipoprotein carrier protein LolA [Streptomyces sp. NPDC051569]|uniref:outer membrane lipoprotein carrier protein LolA n=1 Tax=Streptomyces sp. NPDC051569 TaxID=3365661 RepID=UPI00379CC0BF